MQSVETVEMRASVELRGVTSTCCRRHCTCKMYYDFAAHVEKQFSQMFLSYDIFLDLKNVSLVITLKNDNYFYIISKIFAFC